jgi:DNA topoisomerase-2
LEDDESGVDQLANDILSDEDESIIKPTARPARRAATTKSRYVVEDDDEDDDDGSEDDFAQDDSEL